MPHPARSTLEIIVELQLSIILRCRSLEIEKNRRPTSPLDPELGQQQIWPNSRDWLLFIFLPLMIMSIFHFRIISLENRIAELYQYSYITAAVWVPAVTSTYYVCSLHLCMFNKGTRMSIWKIMLMTEDRIRLRINYILTWNVNVMLTLMTNLLEPFSLVQDINIIRARLPLDVFNLGHRLVIYRCVIRQNIARYRLDQSK